MSDLGDALAWLDRHQNLERMLTDTRTAVPDPARVRRIVDVLGNPESTAPVIHVTGTNGKTSTSRAVTALLMAKGLTVGTFTSPHLERINERISVDGEPVGDGDLAAVLTDLAGLEPLLGAEGTPTWFELLTGAALRYFADRPVDILVIEVGIGGRFDATNVVDATVAVVTNIGMDHAELLGPTRAHIAAEKAGIVKPGTSLVLGEPDPALLPVFEEEAPAALRWVGRDWKVARNDRAVGGRVLDLATPRARYDGIWLDLHGRHQADNFAAAVVAVEEFFAAPVEDKLVREAAGSLRSPGRLEIVGQSPLVVLDGAKNVEGARRAVAAVDEELAPAGAGRILVVGMLGGTTKDPTEMLDAFGATSAKLVVTCPPPSPRAVSASVVADAARALGAARVEAADSVAGAIDVAMAGAGADDVVLITGSLYVVGEARRVLVGGRR